MFLIKTAENMKFMELFQKSIDFFGKDWYDNHNSMHYSAIFISLSAVSDTQSYFIFRKEDALWKKKQQTS